jgi:hypothetical protein
MYEITHKGAWFKWGALDGTEKRLVLVSALAAIPPGILGGLWLRPYTQGLGSRLGSGGGSPKISGLDRLFPGERLDIFVAFVILCALVSGIAWWRFSLRQDELFNRVQNEAIGRGAAWSLAAAALWWMLSIPGWVGPLPLGGLVIFGLFLVIAFWFRAAARWA